MANNKKCAKCGYHIIADCTVCCGHLYKTGRRRPCPPGDDCTAYIPMRRKKAKNSAIDGPA